MLQLVAESSARVFPPLQRQAEAYRTLRLRELVAGQKDGDVVDAARAEGQVDQGIAGGPG